MNTVVIAANNYSTSRGGQRHLARKSNGDLWCVYTRIVDTLRQVFCAYSVDDGLNWIEEPVTTAGIGDRWDAAIAIDSADNVHVVWRYGAYIMYRKRTGLWQAEEIVSAGIALQAAPSLAIDSLGNVHVAWEGLGWGDYPEVGNVQYCKRTDSWQPQEAVTDINYHQFAVSIAIDSLNNVHLAWYGKGWIRYDGQNSIQYRKRTTTWQTQQSVCNINADQGDPCIAIDSLNNVHVVWHGQGHGINSGIYNIQWRKKTTTWQAQEPVTDEPNDQWYPSVALDSLDIAHVVWRGSGWGANPAAYNIEHRERTDTWQVVDSITDRAYDQFWPALMWALHPTVGGIKPNIYTMGYALVFTGQDAGGYKVEYYESAVAPPEEYTLDILATLGGTTDPAPGTYIYAEGAIVAVTALPASGYYFDHWEGDITSTDNPISILLTGSVFLVSILAVFEEVVVPPEEYALAIAVSGEGTTDPAPGSYLYAEGATVVVAAIPASGHLFVEWQEDGVPISIDNPIGLLMDAPRNITAIFEEVTVVTHTLIIGVEGQGITVPAPGSWAYVEGESAIVTAIPDAGWMFDHWEGDISGSANPITISMLTDMSILAVFSEVVVPPEQHALNISVLGQGTTEPPPETYLIDAGTSITVKALPSDGWRFDHWEGDVTGIDALITIEMLEDVSAVAVFTEKPPAPPGFPWYIPAGIAGVVAIGLLLIKGRAKR